MIKLVYILLCAAVLPYTTVFAAQAYTLPEQANQFDMLMKQAQSGSAEAQIELGQASLERKGVPKNPSQTDVVVVSKDKQSSDKLDLNNNFVWYLKAAQQGDAGGQNYQGIMYENGLGVEKDYQQALNWMMSGFRWLEGLIPPQAKMVADGTISHARVKLGVEVFSGLFAKLTGSFKEIVPDFYGWMTVIFDGTTATMPDSEANKKNSDDRVQVKIKALSRKYGSYPCWPCQCG